MRMIVGIMKIRVLNVLKRAANIFRLRDLRICDDFFFFFFYLCELMSTLTGQSEMSIWAAVLRREHCDKTVEQNIL